MKVIEFSFNPCDSLGKHFDRVAECAARALVYTMENQLSETERVQFKRQFVANPIFVTNTTPSQKVEALKEYFMTLKCIYLLFKEEDGWHEITIPNDSIQPIRVQTQSVVTERMVWGLFQSLDISGWGEYEERVI